MASRLPKINHRSSTQTNLVGKTLEMTTLEMTTIEMTTLEMTNLEMTKHREDKA